MSHAFRFTRFAIVWFVLSTVTAMLIYPGGTYRDKTTTAYSVGSNFLSDLGTMTAWGGKPNHAAATLFIVAELVLIAAFVAFFTALVRLYSTGSGRRWARAGIIAGVLACAGFLTAALLPADRFLGLHIQGALLAFRGLLLAAASFTVATVRDSRLSRRAFGGWLLLTVMMAGYIAVLEWGPRASTDFGLTFQATAQKLVVSALLLVIALESVEAERAAAVASRPVVASFDAERT